MPSILFSSPAEKGTRWVPTVQSMVEVAEVEAAFCAVLLPSSRSGRISSPREESEFVSPEIGLGILGVDATEWRPSCSGTVILVVVMCVLITVVEPAVATSKETRKMRLHINMEGLQAEGAIVGRQWVVVIVGRCVGAVVAG